MSDKKNEDLEARMPDGFADEKQGFLSNRPKGLRAPALSWTAIENIEKSPGASILAYCLSSISMTIVNKYVVSGSAWNLPLFYLAVQVGTRYDPCRVVHRTF
jgi:GDP-mannose transporter